jgi:hypothetical protein
MAVGAGAASEGLNTLPAGGNATVAGLNAAPEKLNAVTKATSRR